MAGPVFLFLFIFSLVPGEVFVGLPLYLEYLQDGVDQGLTVGALKPQVAARCIWGKKKKISCKTSACQVF